MARNPKAPLPNAQTIGRAFPDHSIVGGDTLANAVLMAAAPELLAVLERFIALGKSGADTSWYSDDAQDTFYAMMRAIGTAKGEI